MAERSDEKAHSSGDGRHRSKLSWLLEHYPEEDVAQTDMFRPFFQRRRTWLAIAGLALFVVTILFAPVGPGSESEAGSHDPDAIRLGLGIFACIAFLWLTEALPLPATALLVPQAKMIGVGLRLNLLFIVALTALSLLLLQ